MHKNKRRLIESSSIMLGTSFFCLIMCYTKFATSSIKFITEEGKVTKFKPIRVIAEVEIEPAQIILATKSIRHFLNLAGASDLVSVEIHDLIDLNNYYINLADGSRLVNGNAVIGYLIADNYIEEDTFINILLVREQLVINQEKVKRTVRGLSVDDTFGIAAIGSECNEFNNLIAFVAIMHELGHIYGLPSEGRADNHLVQALSWHCPNDCLMFPNASILDKIDLEHKPFCDQCKADLQKKFKQ